MDTGDYTALYMLHLPGTGMNGLVLYHTGHTGKYLKSSSCLRMELAGKFMWGQGYDIKSWQYEGGGQGKM